MNIQQRQHLHELREVFWLLPGLMVIGGVLAALLFIWIDRLGVISQTVLEGFWVYDGGGTGARTLLGAVASSTIGVAGTVFSITIAALSLAAGQMGPRLLRNFVRDRGNQFTLGTFLATFSYSLVVLRSVRTQSEGVFVPHLSLSIAIFLALICVGTLVYFVGHMASRINVDVVIDLVANDVNEAVHRLTSEHRTPPVIPSSPWNNCVLITETRSGYLQEIDGKQLAQWAADNDTVIRLLAKPGNYVFPGSPIALLRATQTLSPPLHTALSIGPRRVGSDDLEFAVRHLVEVAVRALSPGINDPHTAISVLDRLGVVLCHLSGVTLSDGIRVVNGHARLLIPVVDYDGLSDTMFHLIRQNAQTSVSVLIRLLEVLTVAASCDRLPARLATLQRHGDLVVSDAKRKIENVADLEDVMMRHAQLRQVVDHGPIEFWRPTSNHPHEQAETTRGVGSETHDCVSSVTWLTSPESANAHLSGK